MSAPNALPAQSDLRFERLSLEQGVALDLVYCMLQDRTGFMWFGTMYGLIRYDGRRHTIYKHNPADTNSISFNDIITIHEDHTGRLWAGTWGGGLNCFDPITERFTRFVHDPNDTNSVRDNIVWAICEDGAGNIWVGTQAGLDRVRLDSGTVSLATQAVKFQHYRLPVEDSRGAARQAVRALMVDGANRLWIGSVNAGLFCLTTKDGREEMQHFRHDDHDPTSLSHNGITALHQDQKGDLWIGTGNGLNRMAAGTNAHSAETFQHYGNAPNNLFSSSNNRISAIAEDSSNGGTLWVGTVNGLNRLERESQTSERFMSDPSDPYSLRSNSIVALCTDRSGILWVGTYFGGIHKLDPEGAPFVHVRHEPGNEKSLSSGPVRALYEDRSGTLWVGTSGGGLNAVRAGGTSLDPSHRRPAPAARSEHVHYRFDPKDPHGLRSNFITAIAGDHRDHIWVGSQGGGLTEIDAERRLVTHLHHPADSASLSSNNVLCLYCDRAGDLWIGTDNGLNKFDATRRRFVRYLRPSDQPRSLSDNFVHTIFEDRDGILWLGSYRGLGRFDRRTQTLRHYRHALRDPRSLSNDYVYAICEDQAGNLWVGTSDGLNRFDRVHDSFINYKENDGLPNGVICGILEDPVGRLWLSTYRGLSCFDPKSNVFKNYDLADGLQSNMFSIGAAHKSREGMMYFGGANGYNYFHPQAIQPSEFEPPVVLTAVKVFDKRIPPARAAAPLALTHEQNFLSFEFAALSFAQPEKNQYAYRLEGVDRNWVYAGHGNAASYTNVQPGRYVFLVKGANHDGVWQKKEASLAIVISPPFWRTWWFQSVVAGALLSGLIFWYRRRLVRERARVAEIERIRSEERIRRFQEVEQARLEEGERVRKKIAADFHDESGHKLTKISLFCGVLQSKLRLGALEIDEYLERIMKAAASLHKDLSDFVWSLDPAENTLHDTALKLKEFGDQLFEHTGIRFDMPGLVPELEHAPLPMEIRQNLMCIFKEGMNNALKHNRASCKNVTLLITRDNGHFTATLTDDGQGFDLSDGARGHGLRNMQERAAAIGGRLEIFSAPGQGTTIEFKGKLSPSAPVWRPPTFAAGSNGAELN